MGWGAGNSRVQTVAQRGLQEAPLNCVIESGLTPPSARIFPEPRLHPTAPPSRQEGAARGAGERSAVEPITTHLRTQHMHLALDHAALPSSNMGRCGGSRNALCAPPYTCCFALRCNGRPLPPIIIAPHPWPLLRLACRKKGDAITTYVFNTCGSGLPVAGKQRPSTAATRALDRGWPALPRDVARALIPPLPRARHRGFCAPHRLRPVQQGHDTHAVQRRLRGPRRRAQRHGARPGPARPAAPSLRCCTRAGPSSGLRPAAKRHRLPVLPHADSHAAFSAAGRSVGAGLNAARPPLCRSRRATSGHAATSCGSARGSSSRTPSTREQGRVGPAAGQGDESHGSPHIATWRYTPSRRRFHGPQALVLGLLPCSPRAAADLRPPALTGPRHVSCKRFENDVYEAAFIVEPEKVDATTSNCPRATPEALPGRGQPGCLRACALARVLAV
jgi:hypothetical protein